MNQPVVVGGMLYFGGLDRQGPELTGLLTVGFRFTDEGTELWTSRFNSAKDQLPLAVDAACRALAEALKGIDFSRHGAPVLAGAISSGEYSIVKGSLIDRIGIALATANPGWQWMPWLLKKEPHRSLHGLNGAGERDAEVAGKYTGVQAGLRGLVLILDDFSTRGSTLSDAARALKASNPDVQLIYGVALAKTERLTYCRTQGFDANNNHIPPNVENAWLGQ